MLTQSQLPQPDSNAQQLSQQLIANIKSQIQQQGGQLPFSAFMQAALYEPGLGYYSNSLRKFGAAGDFITAPEVSPLFSQCLAQQCQQIFAAIADKSAIILEFGAGSGIMAAELLKELANLNALPEQYWILELSAELRQRQRETLQTHIPTYLDRVQWLDHLPEQPFQGVILANEVLDAMPVEKFRIKAAGEFERACVSWQENQGFHWQWQTMPENLATQLQHGLSDVLSSLPEGYESEWNPALAHWLQSVAEILQHGLILLIDYGFPRHEYYHPQRDQGTLYCHYRHHSHGDPFLYPGLQDITAHVDFTTVAEAALDAGLDVCAYSNQADFLLACGLPERFALSDPDDVENHARLSKHIQTLTLPSEMGELFKVIALGKEIDIALQGFPREQRYRLG